MPKTMATYPLTSAQRADLKTRFTYHPPDEDQAKRYEELRGWAISFARKILAETPASREQSLALTKLEEAVFWTNAAIARHEFGAPKAPNEEGSF